MAEVGSVEALLKLNTSNFDSGITKSIGKIESFVNSMKQMGNSSISFRKGFQTLQNELVNLNTAIDKITASSQKFKNFNTAATGIEKLVNAVVRFNREGGVTVNTFAQLGNGVRAFMNALGGIDINLTKLVDVERQLVAENNQVASSSNNAAQGVNNLNNSVRSVQSAANTGAGSFNSLNNSARNTATTMNNTSNSTKNFNQSLNSTSSSVSSANQRFNGLTRTMGALKSMVSMVGSMFLYNFAHNMMISVQNTVKAKSEMMSFLHTMGMTGGQVDSFNAALDRTVDRFQRVNKYNIGETVANIGLEFNLSAKEMEKAMSVTSMITSEYLRAGRNADEAALAVKDIMQGQFQRLSRETGVKQENLKEAGWSGDTSDVLGLMDALEKVATARHWDVFAEKASSLNDIVLITQNRLSEWAADMSDGIVPIVTGAFNVLVTLVDGFTNALGGIGEALGLPDWTGTAVMIGGLTTAILALIPTFISARTHLGLIDIATQGWKNSLLGAVFGIKAEESANLSSTKAIAAKILGLKAEEVAERGVKGALIEKMAIENKSAALKQRTTSLILGKVMGLNMETVAQRGLLGAIGESFAKRLENVGLIQKDTAATLANNQAKLLGIATIGAYAAILAILAMAFIAVVKPMMDAADAMKRFNDLVDKGDNMIKETKQSIDSYSKKYEDATNRVNQATQGTREYNIALEEQRMAQENLNYATDEYLPRLTQAVEMARSAQSKYDEGITQSAIESEKRLSDAFVEMGINAQKAGDMASIAMADAREGARQLYHALQVYNMDLYQHEQGTVALVAHLKRSGKEDDEIEEIADAYNVAWEKYEKNKQTWMTSASFSERINAGLGMAMNSVELWWTEFNGYMKGNEEAQAVGWEKFWKGIAHGFGDLPGFKNFWDKTFENMGLDKYKHGGIDALKEIFSPSGFSEILHNFFFGKEGDTRISLDEVLLNSLGLKDFDIGKWFQDNVINPISGFGDSISNSSWDLINDIFGNWKLPDLGELFGNLLSGGDSGGMMQIDLSWLYESLLQYVAPIGDSLRAFFENPVEALGLNETFSFWGLIDKIMGWDSPDGGVSPSWFKFEAFKQSVIDGFNGLISYLTQLPSQVLGYLSQVTTNLISWGSQLLANGLSAGSNFLNGVVTHISQLPSRVYSFITQTASYLLNGASQWVSIARNKATETVNAVISQVSQLPQKVYDEFVKIGQRINDAVSSAVQSAINFGSSIKNAVLNALGIHSPGFVQEALAKEFADIGGRIAESRSDAESQATSFGQGIVDGMNAQLPMLQQQAQAITDAMSVSADSQAIDFSGQFVGDYQQDANTITGLNQTMTTDTATTFGMMGTTVNTTIDGISANLQTSYANMNTSQTTALTTMQTNNTNAYNRLQTTTTTSLNNMRNTTQNVTLQMVGAWNHMKDNIIASANQLKTQSTAHFNTLSDHIGTFYRKLQNPSMWGAGDKLPTRYYNSARGNRGRSAVRRAFGVSTPKGKYAGGLSPNNLPQTASLRKIRQMIGNNPIFDGLDMSQEVDVQQFLAMLGGSFGWNDWHPAHFDRVKSTSGEWNMRGPQIMHRIDTGESFQVKEFYNSQPNISFSSFQSMAEALFSAIPYDFYWNSDKYGSWVAALQAGACNCWDGAHAILALANTCGFSGHIEHGTWNGLGHVYAVINGKKMDTTGWQNRRDWNGVSAGSPSNMKIGGENKTVNVNIDMTGATFYGEDDFRQTMEDIAQEVMRKEVNASITVGI